MHDARSPEADRAMLPRGRHLTLTLLFFVMALSMADRTLVNVALPAFKQEFHLSDTELGFLAGLAFWLINAAFALPIAQWADRTSRAGVLNLSLALWSVVTTATAACAGFGQLIAARMALGIAEAGGSSPAHSIISDLYRPHERATALAIYNSGQGLGGFIGLALGALLIQQHGWRTAYLIFGGAGLILALAFRVTLREPARGAAEGGLTAGGGARSGGQATMIEVVRLAWTRPSFIHVILGNGLNGLGTYGATTWMPSFLIRSHGMTLAEAGAWLAPLSLVSGTLSHVIGGWISDRAGRRDLRLMLVAPAALMAVGVPFEIGALLVDSRWLCLLLFFIGNTSVAVFAGAVLSTVQGVAGVRQRTMAAALLLTTVGIIGAGLGPWFNGMLSDGLHKAYGDDSLRLAMIVILCVRLWAAWHVYLASRHIAADFARRPE
jgi:MFS family permease